ncbi:FAD-dependent pyridine nucleotide-disulfide oxidoreductase [Pyrolobus fumarii 1A]|uniref:FAD-dependent pyridine nucleotide-disulfide oxidoreductase n=1 Tax=Pyrolobus fumarii (strain DSM 11204 / 1A) TaxID=694429 RepID=G0ECI5_PYRF1|nr:NAD(P)/FAD-dependent oxidoreductase [Pyrolobus fumarii]AEM39555.1 FAD-dependent pyridine nucleotide-disulfide oxidoreductase [Pyrolobus fumarii 1A]
MATRFDYLVVGAGPGGAWFAREAVDRGLRVAVVEAVKPGFKVCGGAIPALFEKQVGKVPSESIISEVRGFRVYLDGEMLWEEHGSLWGYLLDKRIFLENVLEGVDVYTGRVFNFESRSVKGLDIHWERLVVAAGPLAPNYKGDRIYAVQGIYRGDFDEGVIEIHFDSRLVGYYWVFPTSRREARIGVGGYGEPREFLEMLAKFVKKLGVEEIEHPKGSYINIGGVERVEENGVVYVGEAAGFVYPVTGEGIRPSAMSAKLILRMLEGDESARRELETLKKSINAQRKILDFVKAASPEARARFMKKMGGGLAMRVALGELGAMERLLSLLPSRVASFLARLLG